MILEKNLDGEIIEHDNKFIDKIETDDNTHLCWDCANGYPSKCQKIADLRKGTIDLYDFIKRGYQIIEDDEVTKFTVLLCENFKIVKKRSTDEQLAAITEMRKAMDNILTYYYDTETVEEALSERSIRRANGNYLRLLTRERCRNNYRECV